METPKNQTAEVLYEIMHNNVITRASILRSCGVLNLTARIADLRIRHDLPIECQKIHTKNKFGREISYGSWSIKAEHLTYAKAVYNAINK